MKTTLQGILSANREWEPDAAEGGRMLVVRYERIPEDEGLDGMIESVRSGDWGRGERVSVSGSWARGGVEECREISYAAAHRPARCRTRQWEYVDFTSNEIPV